MIIFQGMFQAVIMRLIIRWGITHGTHLGATHHGIVRGATHHGIVRGATHRGGILLGIHLGTTQTHLFSKIITNLLE